MHRLSSIIVLLIWVMPALAQSQSPHGEQLVIDCAECHNPSGWKIDHSTIAFDHTDTDFDLEGTHTQTECIDCHTSLIFNEAPNDCVACHSDIHSMSVGNDCVRCHDSESWLVDNIPEMHEENGFPLMGAHGSLSCVECHTAETNLRFDRIGNECINCHRGTFEITQNPNHEAAGFSINCDNCHNPIGFGWEGAEINHDFFPLVAGHDIQDCNQCHTTGSFADTDPDCVSCHQNDYNLTANPNHNTLNFSTDCVSCHTTDVDWTPAEFLEHDGVFFPIYSGQHGGTWTDCNECHTSQDNFNEFSCFACHPQAETDEIHSSVGAYIYESANCLSCHPDGSN